MMHFSRNKRRLLMTGLIFIVLLGVHTEEINAQTSSNKPWNNLVKPYLQKNLWIGDEAYIAANSLMVPMHVAFQQNNKEWIQDFQDHFSRLSKEGLQNINIKKARLNTLQYYYLTSQFLYLCENSKYDCSSQEELLAHLIKEMKRTWLSLPAWMWAKDDFKGVKERVLWKLQHKKGKKDYYRAITDEELFIFSISADLKALLSLNGKSDPIIDDIVNSGYEVYVRESSFTETGNWIFQPGVYKDHPDYQYAGMDFVLDEQIPVYVEQIGKDTSHSHRFPLWITSLKNAFPTQSKQSLYFQKVLKGLELQFYENVLVFPKQSGYKIPLTKNYMNGTNGVYRYNYSSLAQGDAYYPFELSGTLTLGWWSFLDSDRIRQVYKDLASNFPLQQHELNILLKKRASTKRTTSIAAGENALLNGYREFICELSSQNNPSNGVKK